MKVIPNYHPPQDYRRPTKTQEKVYVPVNDYPEINFSMIANPLTFLTFTPIPIYFLSFLRVALYAAFGRQMPSTVITNPRTHYILLQSF